MRSKNRRGVQVRFMLALCLLLSGLLLAGSGPAWAKKKPVRGVDDNGNTWRYDKKTKTLTFSGKGVVTKDSRKGNEIICEYECWENEIRKVVFKNGIKGIEMLSAYIDKADEIIMADSITKVGSSAIMSSSNCRKIRFSKNLREVGHLSIDCSSCQEVNLPDSIVKMDWRPFDFSKKLRKIHIPRRLQEIPPEFLDGASVLTHIKIPSSVKIIRDEAFAKTSIENITLPENVEELGGSFPGDENIVYFNGIFYKCKKLREITIKSRKITKVKENAFRGIGKKVVIYVPKGKGKEYRTLFRKKGALSKKVRVVEKG